MKKFNITVNGSTYEVEVEEVGSAASSRPATPVVAAPAPAPVAAPAPAPVAAAPAPKAAGAGEHAISAPMPGKILKILVKEGQAVKAGENLMFLEAMKMQNEILADTDGVVKAINVAEGATVKVGESLAILG